MRMFTLFLYCNINTFSKKKIYVIAFIVASWPGTVNSMHRGARYLIKVSLWLITLSYC